MAQAKDRMTPDRVAIVYGSTAGIGGLGQSVCSAITAVADGTRPTYAFGPGHSPVWSLPGGIPQAQWEQASPGIWPWMARYSWLRWRSGDLAFARDRYMGRWAARHVERIRPRYCYLFTQVARETLRWARAEGVVTAIDNPNGHIRNFQQVSEREMLRWFGRIYNQHPSGAMLERVEEEYELVDRVRVYSEWGRRSMTRFGVPADKIHIIHQSINLERYRPPAERPQIAGPLRVCYVGSLDLRKGFPYLLRAIRAVGAQYFALEIVGATGDRHCAQLFNRERSGLNVKCAPGDTVAAYQRAELLVVPTLEDGLPFVLVEGMACGLPVIVTEEAGAAECVQPGRTGWVIPAARVEPLTAALEHALRRRGDLWEMGRQARADVEQYTGPTQLRELSNWFYSSASSCSESPICSNSPREVCS
jgi:glycosyltransferase involved in cell wall biosynthesis